jgi:lysophospholipase L1-like esterase
VKITGYITGLFLLICSAMCAQAQQNVQWYTPQWVNGVCQHDTGHIYYRLPAELQSQVRPIVWNLSLNTAGEFLHFKTTARSIVIRYGLAGKTTGMPHMPATGVSGVDLYAVDKNGTWNWAPANYRFGDTCVYSYKNMEIAAGASGVDYYLYLPLYNTVQWLSVGVLKNDRFEFIPERKEKPIVAYGTSIMQGAVTSRPGLAWTNILERNLDRMVINLGFSGNGRFEPPIFDLMAKVDAAVYVFDCMPNLSPRAFTAEEIENRIRYGVNKLREAHPNVPLLLTEYPDGNIPYYTDSSLIHERHTSSQVIAGIYRKLKNEGVPNVYLLTEKEIGFDINSTTEATHPNDIGMMKYALAYERKIREILSEPVGQLTTQQPTEQYRDGFDWIKRHEQVIENTKQTGAKAILFGNSIINYWGGVPVAEKTAARGEDSWQQYMQQVQNAGFGNDRIENVLWRIYHGGLDHFQGNKILVMIGTNNLAVNTDEEIVNGLSFLLQQIKSRKPQAEITMIGILPRREKEDRVLLLNKKIKEMAVAGQYRFADFSQSFMTGDHINSALFLEDGLHPNKAGYVMLGKSLQTLL